MWLGNAVQGKRQQLLHLFYFYEPWKGVRVGDGVREKGTSMQHLVHRKN